MNDSRPADVAAQRCSEADDLLRQNKPVEALKALDQALEADRDCARAIIGITMIAERLTVTKYSKHFDRLILHCLQSPHGNPEALTNPAGHLLQLKYGLPDSQSRLTNSVRTESGLEGLRKDGLLITYLVTTINRNLTLESFLQSVRTEIWHRFTQGRLSGEWQGLIAALAVQAHNNEYIWDISESEREWLDATAEQLERLEGEITEATATLFLVFAMYRDPWELSKLRQRLRERSADRWSPALRFAVDRTIGKRARQIQLVPSIPRLSAAENPTSGSVRQMYEANPYPRWLHVTPALRQVDASYRLIAQYPHLGPLPKSEGPMQILMPGIGTGRLAVWAAQRYHHVQITAVDLSIQSLAYGKYMAESYGISNIDFRQGDLLTLEGQYERIECIGVLHHLENPEAGFERLVSCLKQGGVIQIMLYAEAARRDIWRLRTRLGLSHTNMSFDEIRRIRARILRDDGDLTAFNGLARRPDFHSTSGFRDLILHVQESTFTINRLRRMIEAADMRFIGFEFASSQVMSMFGESEAEQRYRKAYPDERTLSSLSNWEAIEASHPNLFGNYTFWCQRP
ncbi:methyltransferase domain-containing protein [Nordella sp. HKS 07]|uniref:class I SAM-dependent methyltransferase n=1 Tax=Nordella sp. HKS 07 TaxID=2712222 RepID=UPI0013E16D23|nr:class I SAM-dependent methyltransferase [Nordella sp. HKS 07]QIG49671.1 methyltransferase domain-containing protein [Nordella sp. HKS 07]